ncbi:MAG: NPCBM/NEW2 domain-containing protein [Candidatus Brocadiia bacterium]
MRRTTALLLALALPGCVLGGELFQPGKVVVRYYHSELDGTDQPYSVWLPRDYDPGRKWPLVVQLHGLGGNYRIGGVRREIEDCVVVAPDGRGNTDYKLWGMYDVLRVVREAKEHYNIDPDRVVMFGISMGGSGSWQIGVHFPDRFAALGPVCGNADHRVWERLWNWGEREPTWMSPKKRFIEATESPAFFAENLVNLPSWPIHGDKDNVVPCGHSRSMVAELEKAGAEVHYVEVPGAGHGVPGDRIAEMLLWLKAQRRDRWPRRVVFKTAWRRHPGAYWVRLHRFQRAFAFARIEAEVTEPNTVRVKTDNVEEFSLNLAPPLVEKGQPVRVLVNVRDRYEGPVPADGWVRLRQGEEGWRPSQKPQGLHKTPALEGPIHHAFMSSFVIVRGTQGDHELAKRVSHDEARILADRWNRWARGKCRVKKDRDVTEEDIANHNLILVGDPSVNSLIPRVMDGLPIRVEGHSVVFGEERFEGDDLGFKLVYPNPLNPSRYVALFTGTTWRGVYQIVGRFGNWFDWGILDGWHWQDFAVFDDHTYSPETFLAVGFFDNDWELDPQWYVRGDREMRFARPPRKTPRFEEPPEGAGQIYLSDLQPAHVRIEKGAVARDRSFNAFPLTLGERTYEHGLGVHPNCDIGFDLGGRFPTFEAVVGSDLEGQETVSEARDRAESFEFMVIGDGKMIYQTGRMRWDSEPRHIYVPIQGVRRLELKIHRRSGPRWLSGPVDWAIAKVGEPIHNDIAVQPQVPQPQRLVDVRSLDGAWELASFEVGEGIRADAHRGAPEARRDAIEAPVPASVYAALDAAGQLDSPDQVVRREWWYWREFDVPAAWAARSIWVELDGAAYQVDCWLNGRWIGRSVGPFVPGRFEATQGAKLGERNVLAVRVVASPAEWMKGEGAFRPRPASELVTSQELADRGFPPLGLWRPVRLKAVGPCLVRDLQVDTLGVTETTAHLRVRAEIENLVDAKLSGELVSSFGGVGFEFPPNALAKEFTVKGHSSTRVEFEVELKDDPWRWSPHGLGEQPLHTLTATARLPSGAVADEASLRFGTRTLALDASSEHARFRVNGRRVGLRGCMWLPADALLRLGPERYEPLLARARQCGFNTLRVWGGGLAETETFYGLCDRLGFLVLQDFPLTGEGSGQDPEVYLRNAEAMVRRLRHHPSLAAWCVGGALRPGGSPSPRLTAELAALCERLDPRRRLVADSPRTGVARVWTTRTDPATRRIHWRAAEMRVVPGVPSPSTPAALEQAPAGRGVDLAWPRPDRWPAAGSLAAAAYGPSDSPRRQVLKAQVAQAAAVQRAMERARLAPASRVFWQLNEPVAGTSAALVDAAAVPKPAYYALHRALAPTAVFADFGAEAPTTLTAGQPLRGEVCAVAADELAGATARARVLSLSLRPLAEWEARFDAAPGVLARPLVFDWTPGPELAGEVVLLALGVDAADGETLASNLYWLAVVEATGRIEPLRVAWFTARPRGLLADERFLAAAGIEVRSPDEELFGPAVGEQDDAPPFADCDVIVLDAATVLEKYLDQDMAAVAKAVARGCGLLIQGHEPMLLDSSLAPLVPWGHRGPVPRGIARQPVVAEPRHPAVSRVDFSRCPRLGRRKPLAVRNGTVVVHLGSEHPLLVEGEGGRGRVMALLAAPDGELAGWPGRRRLYAGILSYLAALPYAQAGRRIDAALPAPFQALDGLGSARVEAKATELADGVAVTLTNRSGALAFMVHLEAVGPSPAALSFTDNYFSLLPGQRRDVLVTASPAAGPGAREGDFALRLRGWNVPARPLDVRLALDEGRVRLRRRGLFR